jgi:hypothetical protein
MADVANWPRQRTERHNSGLRTRDPEPNPFDEKVAAIVPDQCDESARLIVKSDRLLRLCGSATPKGHCGGTGNGFLIFGEMEVTMSYWRKSHELERSYLADWVIAASVVLALAMIAYG